MSELSDSKYNLGFRNTKYTFAEYPSIKVYKSTTGSSWGNHLLFGDYVKILDTKIINGRVRARSRGTSGWVKTEELTKKRLLEVNFVDIGQGDGCHIVTPDNKQIVIDAGKTDNMARYLSWRFNLSRKTRPLSFPFTVVISHSDSDHYAGFGKVFENDKVRIDKIYHNGLVERPGSRPLGKKEAEHITGLVQDTADMLKILNKKSNRSGSGSLYCKTLFKVLKHNPNVEFISLAATDNFLGNYNDTHKVHNKECSIKILGPILSTTNGKDSLKTINNLGKDKNGHSVILKFKFDKARVLLGGDVNTEFGEIIHKYYKDRNELDELTVDVAKACHHGSNHFHYEFVQDINAAATVISSGDDEGYAHPRPDTIGALGKCGYGEKPLIFSTELARSNKEFTFSKLQGIAKKFDKIKKAKANLKIETDVDKIKKLEASIKKTNKEINAFQTKYGMINVRTDGKRMILAQKYERAASHGKWDIHELKYSNSKKRFVLQ